MFGTRGKRTMPELVSSPSLRLTLPKEIKIVDATPIPLLVSDFRLSWMDYFGKHKPALHQRISAAQCKDKLELSDNRSYNRQSWTLNNTVREFVDSFERNMQRYTATIRLNPRDGSSHCSRGRPAKVTPHSSVLLIQPGSSSRLGNVNQNPGPSHGRISRAPELSVGKGGVLSSSRATQKRKQSSALQHPATRPQQPRPVYAEDILTFGNESISRRPPNAGRFGGNLAMMDDDAASMADSIDSQDSQSDLLEHGIQNKVIKPKIMEIIGNKVDNVDMVRIEKELREVMNSGKWMKRTARIPYTANFLQMVFLQ